MKHLFSAKEKLILGVVALVLLLYLALLQFYFLSPLKTDLKEKQQSFQSEQKLLATLQKNSGENQTADENTTELQKEVPVKPLQDQFILDLQKAEAESNSQIKSMSFTDGGQAATASAQPTSTNNTPQTQTQSGTSTASQTNTTAADNQQQNTQTASTSSGQPSTNTAKTTPGAPALNKLTVQLSIESQRYEDLEKFINTLESSKRITVVEAINYTGNKEITSVDQNNKPLDYTLTVSVYYLPSLTDLDKQLPKVDFPAPANKDNPLSQFASTDSSQP